MEKDKKPSFALLISGAKKNPEEPKDEDKTEGEDDSVEEAMSGEKAKDSALKDMLNSSVMGDHKGFGSALQDYMELCYPSLSEGKEDDKEEPRDNLDDSNLETDEDSDKAY